MGVEVKRVTATVRRTIRVSSNFRALDPAGVFVKAKVFESDGLTLVIELDSGETFSIQKHDILLPDSTIHQSDEFNEDFQLPIAYSFPMPGGRTTSFRTGDEFDIWQTVFNNGLVAAVGERALIDPNDFEKLLTKNVFGTLERFTNDKGLLTYDGSGGETVNYAIDHCCGLAWLTLAQSDIPLGNGSLNWDGHIDGALAWTQGVYSDFFLPSLRQLETIMKLAGKTFNYAPFSTNANTTHWTSTTTIISTLQAYRNNRDAGIFDDVKTGLRNAYYCRKHF